MGRELRKVPANWEHPKKHDGETFQPMREDNYETAVKEWFDNHNSWLKGEHPDQPNVDCKYYAEWDGDCPEIAYYNTFYKPEDAKWFQLYETVSEGTPVSPPFATEKELAEYLAENGDFWYQNDIKERRFDTFRTKPTLEQAYSLIDSGSACTMIMKDGILTDSYQMQDLTKGDK